MMPVASPGCTTLVGHAPILRVHHAHCSRVLYVGVTNDIVRRVDEHKRGLTPGFTTTYHVTRLVHLAQFADVRDAIAREKEIKGWGRTRKMRLLEERNPTWEDLADRWF